MVEAGVGTKKSTDVNETDERDEAGSERKKKIVKKKGKSDEK